MKATTIKLEGQILHDLEAMRPSSTTLTGFVRELLQRELNRRKSEEAGIRYREFLNQNLEAREEAEVWESAPLASPPHRKKKS